mgnify:FL=1
MSTIQAKKIQDRLEKLDGDINNLRQAIQDFDRKKLEAVAQLNAVQGARQQCQQFLTEIKSDNENALVNDPNTQLKDLGGLGEDPKSK